MAGAMKNVFNDPDMVLSDTGLYEFVSTGAQILGDVASKLEAAQMTLYRGLQSAGKRELTCRMVSLPLGMSADAVMEAKRSLERTWRVARVMIRGLGKAQTASRTVKAFKIGGQVASGDD